jgi:hypothetical protein
MKKFTKGLEVSFSMLYGGGVTAVVSKVTATEVVLTESWIAEDTLETVKENTTYAKSVDDAGNEYITVWEYHGETGVVYGAEVIDFREVKEVVKDTVAQLKAEDPNWNWRADVLKNEIRVWWGYLQYCDKADSHFTIKMSDRPEESSTDDFVVAMDEHNEYMCGAIIGTKSYEDGDLSKCVEGLLRGIASKAHSCY